MPLKPVQYNREMTRAERRTCSKRRTDGLIRKAEQLEMLVPGVKVYLSIIFEGNVKKHATPGYLKLKKEIEQRLEAERKEAEAEAEDENHNLGSGSD